jgi:hypothetical protein
MAATAVEAWDERWATPEGRDDWLVPHPAVAALVPVLKARGTQHEAAEPGAKKPVPAAAVAALSRRRGSKSARADEA